MSDLDDEGQAKRSFKVEDRRRFSETGEAREETEGAAEDKEAPPAAAPAATAGQQAGTGGMPPIQLNFSTFVISLSTQALAHLGEIADPSEGQIAVDLVGAKQLIDILGMLGEKTKGNLDEAESALLEHCLYDLRLKYVEVARRRTASPSGS